MKIYPVILCRKTNIYVKWSIMMWRHSAWFLNEADRLWKCKFTLITWLTIQFLSVSYYLSLHYKFYIWREISYDKVWFFMKYDTGHIVCFVIIYFCRGNAKECKCVRKCREMVKIFRFKYCNVILNHFINIPWTLLWR